MSASTNPPRYPRSLRACAFSTDLPPIPEATKQFIKDRITIVERAIGDKYLAMLAFHEVLDLMEATEPTGEWYGYFVSARIVQIFAEIHAEHASHS
ncbi:hypothetical protein JR316_0012536 [Psilocybe cubensis]|uniref:Uncharacterized protein n=2 Tax=Psilocybe cubensis TaxID=181762 RepID=A0ACB8GIZ5_PSICU|nr:hypothetical protein JR316_0012536 [Psilocybe cubensis]KAH9475425.1 hypothetical protein JR316_0012536 [Psilocybe cubensis]